ncbi:uncharacterized protein LOC124928138 [Impatiens glandulifera]|uniref:uncharacterized protein LOC124928138 n=1 Tax=Impatiens glandulifera TaxID=253017 RepID=UPI001FB0E904|nr:uncharacterized protein LOC124928138 [Impatiens glandulifera]
MVGIFSRFSGAGHRRSQTVIGRIEEEGRQSSLGTIAEIVTPASSTSALMAVHGIEVSVEFKPLEHPIEPINNDAPIQCPLLEPCILNDVRIWKQRIAGGAGRRSGLERVQTEPKIPETELRRRVQRGRGGGILPSISAPESSITKLLDECNASEM